MDKCFTLHIHLNGFYCFYVEGLDDYLTTVYETNGVVTGSERYYNLADYIVDAQKLLERQVYISKDRKSFLCKNVFFCIRCASPNFSLEFVYSFILLTVKIL